MSEESSVPDGEDDALEYDLGPRREQGQTAAGSLAGKVLPGGWRISESGPLKRCDPGGGSLSGGNFSVCYEAEGPEGQRAAIKMFDFEKHMRDQDPVSEVGFWGRMFAHERDLLIASSGNRATARRIVRLYTSGTVSCRFEGEPIAFPVSYLVMERADVDVRVLLSNSTMIDAAWLLKCLHDVAAALATLHRHEDPISHGDTKPSNVMYFEALRLSKLGDLGSATGRSKINPALEDGRAVHLGDLNYMPPEYLYGYYAAEWGERFQAVDLYLLGQLALYFFTFENMTARVIDKLPPNHRPISKSGSWRGDFATILPHLEDAFEEVLAEVRRDLTAHHGEDLANEISLLIQYLCHPDPSRRGHPKNQDRDSVVNPFDLTRFIGRFNTLSETAALIPGPPCEANRNAR